MKNLIHFFISLFVLPVVVLFWSTQAGDNAMRWLTVVAEHEELLTAVAVVILLLTIRAFEQDPISKGRAEIAFKRKSFTHSVSEGNRRRAGRD